MSTTFTSITGLGEGREDYSAPVLGPLSRGMRTERRSTTSNDNGIVTGASPTLLRLAASYRGKYYPRGCRGVIEEVQIYSIATAGGTITLGLSPHPSLGPVMTVVITPGATWGWAANNIRQVWSYDSLFIWIVAISADVSWAYDEELSYDGHQSTDTGVTWLSVDTRPFIRAVYTGETAGDIPVSGIINNIPIPNASSATIVNGTIAGPGDTVVLFTLNAPGFHMRTDIQVSHDQCGIEIYCDGVLSDAMIPRTLFAYGFTNNTPGIQLLSYEVDDDSFMHNVLRYEWRRTFEMRLANPTANNQFANVVTVVTLLR